MEEKNIDSRVYEVSFLFVPTLSEDEVLNSFNSLRELILSFEGETISDEMPKIIELAYTMQKTIKNKINKFDNGYFGWIKFFMDAEKVSELKKKLDLSSEIIRFLIVKTVKENTMSLKKFNRDNPRRRSYVNKKEGKVEEEINKEEVDKEIEAMVESVS
jgi:ribosomal protein S6